MPKFSKQSLDRLATCHPDLQKVMNEAIKHMDFVVLACLLGFGVEVLLIVSGFWFGREHSQAEYRYMKLKGITREELSDIDGFRLEAWNYDSFVNDLVLPIMVGGLVLGVSYVM